MSGSPKYCEAELAAQTARRIEEERRAAAQREAALRRERELREEQLQFARHKASIKAAVVEVSDTFNKYQRKPFATFVRDEIRTIHFELGKIDGRIAAATDYDELEEAESDVGRLAKLVARMNALGLSRQAAAKKAHEMEKELAECANRLDEEQSRLVDAETQSQVPGQRRPRTRAEMDREGSRDVDATIQNVKKKIDRKDLSGARSALRTLTSVMGRHLEKVKAVERVLDERYDAARTLVRTFESRLAGLRASPDVGRWCGGDVSDVERTLEHSRALLSKEQLENASRVASDGLNLVDQIVAIANTRQLEEDKRAHIVSSYVEVLRRFKFSVGAIELEVRHDPDSGHIITARREHDRRSLSINVPLAGPVEYDVDGYEKKSVALPNGSPANVCDNAESQLEEIHAMLKTDEFGVNTGELSWDGRNPGPRRRKGAKELPIGGAIKSNQQVKGRTDG